VTQFGKSAGANVLLPVLLLTIAQTACESSLDTNTLRKAVSGGGSHALALNTDGSAWAWGYNGGGQLGDGTTTNSSVPIAVKGLSKRVIAVAAGGDFSLALESDGSVWAWGTNDRGQLGNGTNVNSGRPSAVNGLTGRFVAIAACEAHGLALRSDGSVWGWGDDYQGQLGNGSNADTTTAVAVTGLTGRVVHIGCGFNHSLAVKSNGSVWAWGDNSSGELGTHTAGVYQNTPVAVDRLTSGVIAVAGGASHSMALKSDGSVWTWGVIRLARSGEYLGSDVATPVAGLAGVKAIGAGWGLNFAYESNVSIWAWGENFGGDLGNGSNKDSTTRVKVVGLRSGVIAIASGWFDGYAVKSDGSVWAWGSNNHGELGNGTIDPKGGSNIPVVVKAFSQT